MFNICDERTDDMMFERRFLAAARRAGAYQPFKDLVPARPATATSETTIKPKAGS